MRDEKVHILVARSTFRSQNVQNTPCSDHFWKLRWWKSAHRCGAKHISKSTCTKHLSVGPLLEVEMSKKCMPLWHEAHFQIKMYKAHQPRSTFSSCDVQNTPCSDHSWKLRCRKSARRCGAKHISKSKCEKHIKTPHVRATFGPCQKWAKRERFVAFPKTMAGEDLQRCIFRDRRSTRDMFIRAVTVGGPGADFLRGVAEMILRDRCSTSYDPVSLFRGRRSTLDRWTGKITKRIGTRPSALHSTFHVWRKSKSRRIASFLMLST